MPSQPVDIDCFGESTMVPRPELYKLIRRGRIAAHRTEIAAFTRDGITLRDGDTLGVDCVVPVSTIIMLRSIAEIARSEGEDLSHPEAALSCVQVFALGGRPDSADASESGYFAVRGLLAKSVTQAARFIVERGVIEEGAPILVRFITQVASRFGMVVTQKLAAQAIPLGGAAVNYAFIEHFQDVARGHFTVRQLERTYGKEPVRREYERLAQVR